MKSFCLKRRNDTENIIQEHQKQVTVEQWYY